MRRAYQNTFRARRSPPTFDMRARRRLEAAHARRQVWYSTSMTGTTDERDRGRGGGPDVEREETFSRAAARVEVREAMRDVDRARPATDVANHHARVGEEDVSQRLKREVREGTDRHTSCRSIDARMSSTRWLIAAVHVLFDIPTVRNVHWTNAGRIHSTATSIARARRAWR